jgi:predicted nucleic-acid-binding protein
MIGIDTNVLVRYIAQDDEGQSPIATELMESLTAENPGYVSLVVVVELVWVLAGCYASNRTEICQVLDNLLRTKEIVVAQADVVLRSLRRYADGKGDFADFLIAQAANEAGCDEVVTFDKAAGKFCGMRELLVP